MSKSGKYVIIHFIAIDAADAEWPLLPRGFGQRTAGTLSKCTGSQNGLLSGWDVRHITSALPTELLGAFV